jgi:hypothetical protein
MLKIAKFATLILLVVFTSCAKENVDPRMDNTMASSRTAKALKLEILTTEGATIFKNADKAVFNSVSDGTFTVVIDPSTESAITFTATLVNVTHETGHLRIITNPGFSPVTYTDKYMTTITSATASAMKVAINPGNIVTNAGSLVVDENDGI